MPMLRIILLLIIWLTYPVFTNIYFIDFSILLMILILRLNRYVIIIMGWISRSLYSMIGVVRLIAQRLSYEVRFIIILLVQIVLIERYTLGDLLKWQIYIEFIWILYPLIMIFFIRILAELNRSPIDFIEGESELVSGFNVEYFRGLFAIIFLTEYGIIIFMSLIIIYIYIGGIRMIYSIIIINLIIISVIYIRGILPRIRYDELIFLCWKIVLPLILNYLIYFIIFKILINILI